MILIIFLLFLIFSTHPLPLRFTVSSNPSFYFNDRCDPVILFLEDCLLIHIVLTYFILAYILMLIKATKKIAYFQGRIIIISQLDFTVLKMRSRNERQSCHRICILKFYYLRMNLNNDLCCREGTSEKLNGRKFS